MSQSAAFAYTVASIVAQAISNLKALYYCRFCKRIELKNFKDFIYEIWIRLILLEFLDNN